MQEFVVAVEVLQHETGSPDPEFDRAFTKLARALQALGDDPELQRRSKRIAVLGTELESRSGPKAKGALLAALDEAVASLRSVPGRGKATKYQHAAEEALASVVPASPMTALAPYAVRALVNVANGLLVSVGADPALDAEAGARANSPSSSMPAPDARRVALQASAIVANVSGLEGNDHRRRIADALEALLRGADEVGAAHDAEVRSRIAFETRRLRSSDDGGFESAAWVRTALLGIIQEIRPPEGGESWVDRARASAQTIDPDNALVFQRAIVQEALRSTADALLVLSDRPRR